MREFTDYSGPVPEAFARFLKDISYRDIIRKSTDQVFMVGLVFQSCLYSIQWAGPESGAPLLAVIAIAHDQALEPHVIYHQEDLNSVFYEAMAAIIAHELELGQIDSKAASQN